MAEFPALPIFTDAYLADTRHLSAAQHGAYLLLLMMAWRLPDCALPDNDETLAKWCSMDKRTFLKNKDAIMSFWSRNDAGKFVQKRLLDERKYVVQLRSKNSEAGKASALKRLNRGSTSVQPKVNETSTPTPTPTPIPKRKNIQAAKPPDVSDQVWQDFVEHRKAKKAPLTETALKQIEREALKAGWTMEDALSEVCARAWQGFKADWVESRAVASKQENTFTGWRRDLANEIPPADVAAWFKTATVEDGRMIVDKKFTADWIKSHYAVQIEKVLGRVAIEVRK
jgi:uncharacterized protein YdaU (DUF1376 family)